MCPQDFYNIAIDCIDKHADSLQHKHNTALLYFRGAQAQPLRLSYDALKGLTNRMANAFQSLGPAPGNRVALRLPNIPEFSISFLGAVKAGLIPVPTSPLLTVGELEFILRDSEATVLVTTEELLPEKSFKNWEGLKHLIVLTPRSPSPYPLPQGGEGKNESPSLHRWQDLLKTSAPTFSIQPTKADDPAFWLYTSGTTGEPKAVIHAHRSIRAHDGRAKLWQDIQAGDVVFNTSALNWSYHLTCGLLDVWRHGQTSLLYNGPLNAEDLIEVMRRGRVTTLMSVPGIYRRLLETVESRPHPDPPPLAGEENTGQTLPHLRVCLSAGEKLAEEIRRDFFKRSGIRIYEGLGMTEHSVYLIQPYGQEPVPGSCGRPLPGQPIAILTDTLDEAGPGEIGVLASHRSCAGLMLGYFNRPAEEALVFRGDWFLSGDLASRDEQGNFFFLGRNDDVINAGGYRISPLEVEAALTRHEAVTEAAAFGLEKEKGHTLVAAALVLKPTCQHTAALKKEILIHAEKFLAKYKMPREILFVDSIPKTAQGKLQRQILREKYRFGSQPL